MRIQHLNQTMVFNADRSLFLEGSKPALIVADLHLGKSAAFRARGLAVPEGDTPRDLQRLLELVRIHRPDHLVIAGDLFHSAAGLTSDIEQEFDQFRSTIGCRLTLVVGNHDAKLARLPSGLEAVDQLHLGGIHVVHDPKDRRADAPMSICGHLHPVARIEDGKRTRLRLPCFHLSDKLLVLPAFGSFTGGRIIEPEPGDRVFVFPGNEVVEVPPSLWA